MNKQLSLGLLIAVVLIVAVTMREGGPIDNIADGADSAQASTGADVRDDASDVVLASEAEPVVEPEDNAMASWFGESDPEPLDTTPPPSPRASSRSSSRFAARSAGSAAEEGALTRAQQDLEE